MKDGAGKFTKVCLMTALVTFILGCIICGVGALFGGFRVLENTDVREITGIPFRFHRYDNGDVEYGFGWDDFDWDDFDEWDTDWDDDFDWSKYEKWNKVSKSGDVVEFDLTADTFRNLYVELGLCELHIMEAKDDHVSLKVSGTTKNFRYIQEDGDSLHLVNMTGKRIWNWGRSVVRTKVHLYLPEGTALDYAGIEIGAGSAESIGIQAHEMNLDVGAGECTVNGSTTVDSMNLTVGAGRIILEDLNAGDLNIDVGAGELFIKNARTTGETDLSLGMGNAELNGLFTGDMDIECGMGNVTLKLDDAESDHNFDIECALGNVRLGSRSYTGLADEVSINNGSRSTYDVECNMGNVRIEFDRE